MASNDNVSKGRRSQSRSQAGFHVVELVIALAVVGVLGFAGYGVWQRGHKSSETTKTSTATQSTPEIKNSDDLDSASSTVDELDSTTNESDLNTLEQELNAL